MNMSQKFSFLALIFGLLEGQKSVQVPNEILSAPVQPYVFRLKEMRVVTKGEQDSGVATKKPFVATKAQPGGSSSGVMQSFFKAKLSPIKDK